MKKMNVTFLVILMVSLLVGCSSDDTNEKQKNLSIVGTWVTNDNESEIVTIIFNSDNTGKWFLTYEGKVETIHKFTYTFDGKNTLKVTEEGKTETGIVSLTNKKLTIGETTYYKQE